MEWDEESQLELIKFYESKPNLWNPKDINYYRKNKKYDSWVEIAQLMSNGRTWEECKKKMVSLLTTYRKEKKKVRDSHSTGTGRNDAYVSHWIAVQALDFLQDRDQCRRRMDTVEISQVNEELGAPDTQESEPEGSASTSASVKSNSISLSSNPKKRKQDNEVIVTEAVNMMKMATDVLKRPQSKTTSNLTDEVTAFANFMACKMMQYPENTRKFVEYDMIDVLKRADLGYYDQSRFFQSANPPQLHNHTQYSSKPQQQTPTLIPPPQSSNSSHSSSTQFYPNIYSGHQTHSCQLTSSQPPTNTYITLTPLRKSPSLTIPATSQQNQLQEEQANDWSLSNTQHVIHSATSSHHSIYSATSPTSNYSEDINEFI